MNVSLHHLENFAKLLHHVQRVKRFSRRPGETEVTTTAEHTFELAMMCWYIATVEELDLNLEKILMYALAHDLIEAYAGDTPAYDTAGQVDKAEREHRAFQQLSKDFPEFSSVLNAIEEYELRESPEAKFVYATDKLVDPLNTSLEDGLTHWKEKGVKYEDMRNYKDKKVAHDPTILRIWQDLVKKFERRKNHYFDVE